MWLFGNHGLLRVGYFLFLKMGKDLDIQPFEKQRGVFGM